MDTDTKKVGDKPLREGDRLIGGNVKFSTTLEKLFEKIGEYVKILDLHLPMTADGKQNKGWFILRMPSGQADKLLDANILLDGRVIRFEPAH